MEKAQAIAALGIAVGVAVGKPSTVGASLLAATKSSSYSAFASVKKIVVKRRRQTIHVVSGMEHNQVYASKEQFDFVLDYIVKRCPHAVIKGGGVAA